MDESSPEIIPEFEDLQHQLLQPSTPFKPDAPLPKSGDVLDGRFEVANFLGAGGMGLVYSGIDKESNMAVAIKTPKPGCPYGELIRLLREGELKIPKHKSLANCLARFVENGRPYTVSEKVDGRSLCEILQSRLEATGPQSAVETPWFKAELSVSIAVQSIIEVCNAVDLLHRHGIVHRDLKPGNIVWHPEGRAVLIDFGLAFQADGNLLSKPEQVGGTTAYMAPEQWQGQAQVDARSDIYSLGASLFHLLTGTLPEGAPKTAETFDGQTLPRGLLQIIQKAMERGKRHRFQSVNELCVALQHWQDNRGPVPGVDSLAANCGRWVRQRRFKLTATLAVIAVLLASILSFMVVRGSVDRGTLAGIAFGSARAKDEILLYGTQANPDALIDELFRTYSEVIRHDPNLDLEVSQFARRRALRLALGTGRFEVLHDLINLLPNPSERGWATVEDFRLNACAYAVAHKWQEASAQLRFAAERHIAIKVLAEQGIDCLHSYHEQWRLGQRPGTILGSGDATKVYGWHEAIGVGVDADGQHLWLVPAGFEIGDENCSVLFRIPLPKDSHDGISFATLDLNNDGIGEIYFEWQWNNKTGAGLVLSDAGGRMLRLDLPVE